MNEIVFIVVIGIVLVAFCYVIINQMLLINSVNKRLMLLVEDSLNMVSSSVTFDSISRENLPEEEEQYFDPHDIEV